MSVCCRFDRVTEELGDLAHLAEFLVLRIGTTERQRAGRKHERTSWLLELRGDRGRSGAELGSAPAQRQRSQKSSVSGRTASAPVMYACTS